MADKYKKPNALDFLSTQDFVKQIDQWASKEFQGYSRRTFAKWAGISSPNFMSLVIDGKRPLRGKWLEGLCHATQLPDDQREHLRALSLFEGSKSPRKRKELLEKIHESLSKLNSRSLAHDQLEVLTQPLAWTVLQMLDLKDRSASPIWFKQRLRSRASSTDVVEALALLKRLGLTQKEGDEIRPAHRILKSSDQVTKSTNSLFHKSVLQEAIAILDQIAPEERAYGSFTATVAEDKIEQLKKEINKFGQYLLSTYAASGPVEGEVVRLNIQLYPLTSKNENSNE
jgi:uncharacterized protein (TIGR02147 family)